MTMALTEFLTARFDEDEAVARGAIDLRRPGPRWQWVCADTDVPVRPGDEAAALDEQNISLRSVEEFPVQHADYELPAFLIHSVDEGEPGALRHIAHFDPARVLAEAEAKRRIVALHVDCTDCTPWGRAPCKPCDTLMALALPYADHPDFDPDWATR